MPECMICGNRVSGGYWACARCESAYPDLRLPKSEWPDWARYLRNEEQTRRRRLLQGVVEITASDMASVDRLLYGD